MFRPIRLISAGLIAIAMAAGCKAPNLTGPGEDVSLPENHPSPVGAAASFSGQLAWSANGHLAYVLPGWQTAVARLDGTGPVRVLHTADATSQIVAVALSPDASEWFTVTTQGEARVLRWHRGGTSEVLTDRANPGDAGYRAGSGVMVAGNGDFAYVVRPDSLFLKRGDTAPRALGVGCHAIAAVSPTGDGVICFQQDPFRGPLQFTADGSVTTISGSEAQAPVIDLQWTSNGIDVLQSAFTHFVFERLSSPQSKFSTPTVQYPELYGGWGALAADGRSFVYASSYCARSGGFFNCDKSQLVVYHADAVARTTRRVAVQTIRDQSELSISPDGRRIAYTLDGQLYVIPVQ